MKRLKILLLSAYAASSHRYWRELLVEHLTEFDWTVVELPDRHFYWRVRSNALTYAMEHRKTLLEPYDLVMATSMVDLCGLRGLLPSISSIPTILYFHENQFAYPVRKPSSNIINSQLVSVYSAMSADRVLFNSEYNMQSFLNGARELFEKMPDGVPANVMGGVESNSRVVPVPILTGLAAHDAGHRAKRTDRALEIVWNHRWEYDKQPEVFFAAMQMLQEHGVEFVLHVMGQSFREVPPCFNQARESLGDRVATWGYQPRESYLQILRRADFVVSCAAHDFQGLGMLEAISLGCVPVAPARVAYREYIPSSFLYQSEIGDNAEPEFLFNKINSVLDGEWPSAPDVSRFYMADLVSKYRQAINKTIEAAPGV